MAKKPVEPKQFEDDDHQVVVQQFEEFADSVSTTGAQALWQKCRNYRDGKQYTDEETAILKRRKQPIITDNKIQDKCDTLLGMEKQMRTDPKAYPRNPSDEDQQSAEAATDALRFIADQSDYKVKARKGAADNLMVEGICAGQVIVEKRKGQDPRICMERVRQDRLYYDIRSLEDDFSDKTYCGYFTWLDEAVVIRDWPESQDMVQASVMESGSVAGNESFDDKPRYLMSAGKRKRIQVFTHYHQKGGVWHESRWIRGGWLEKPRPCVYKDEFGEPQCCLELQALYRDAEGNPYGMVPRYLDLQDEHNKRRSKMLHLLSAKRAKVRKGVVDSINALRSEMHRPDGVIEINGLPEDLAIEDNLKEAEGQWRLLQQTDMALSMTGPNAALSGTSGTISGIAKARDQQAGQLPVSPLFDALDSWELRMYRQAWCRVRQFWTAEMWVRVTDSEDKPKWVGINQPVTQGERLATAAKNDPQFQQLPPEEQQAMIQQIAQDPASQIQAIDDKTGKPMRRNDVGVMDVDIIIDRGQDVVTIQQEEFAQLAEIAKMRPEIPFDVLVEMSQLRQTTKKRVAERLKGDGNDPLAAQRAMQQVQQQAQLLQQQAEEMQKQAAQLQQEEAANTKAKSDLQVASANLSVQEAELSRQSAEFDAHVAQAQAKAIESQLQQAQQTGQDMESAMSGQIARTAEDLTRLAAEVNDLANAVVDVAGRVTAPKPRIRAIRQGRDERGAIMAIPEYEDDAPAASMIQ
jgi:hypothetical protein